MMERPTSPRLLVSVRDPNEASLALQGGADLIDVKEPDRGPLGMADRAVIESVFEVALDDGPAPVTCALGELRDWRGRDPTSHLPDGELALVKVGLAGERGKHDWRRRFEELAAQTAAVAPLVATAYADALAANSPDPADVARLAALERCPFLLLDTFEKNGRSLLEILSAVELSDLRDACGEAGIGFAVAGSLRARDLATITRFSPDVVAVRGAACSGGDRRGRIDPDAVRRLRERLSAAVAVVAAQRPL